MTREQAVAFVGEVQACRGSGFGTKEAKEAYVTWATSISVELADRTLRHLEKLAGPGGFKGGQPSLSALRNTLDSLIQGDDAITDSATVTSQAEYPPCQMCNQSGLVFVVKAGMSIGTMKVRRRTDVYEWPFMLWAVAPCSCPAGDYKAKFYNDLSLRIRNWIFQNAAYRYQYDAETFIRQCHGLPPVFVERATSLATTPAKIIATSRKRAPTGRQRDRETERPNEQDTWI